MLAITNYRNLENKKSYRANSVNQFILFCFLNSIVPAAAYPSLSSSTSVLLSWWVDWTVSSLNPSMRSQPIIDEFVKIDQLFYNQRMALSKPIWMKIDGNFYSKNKGKLKLLFVCFSELIAHFTSLICLSIHMFVFLYVYMSVLFYIGVRLSFIYVCPFVYLSACMSVYVYLYVQYWSFIYASEGIGLVANFSIFYDNKRSIQSPSPSYAKIID